MQSMWSASSLPPEPTSLPETRRARRSFAKVWNSAARDAPCVVIGFGVASREEVDRLYQELTATGYRGQQRPYDAFWGARYAIVEDPDGNPVGLMSPSDPEHRSWPPGPAPK